MLLLVASFVCVEGRPPAGFPDREGPDTVWEFMGLAEALLVVWLVYESRWENIRERFGMVVRIGTMMVLSPTYLTPFLRDGGSLSEGIDNYLDWLVDNYLELVALQEFEDDFRYEIELEETYGRYLRDEEC